MSKDVETTTVLKALTEALVQIPKDSLVTRMISVVGPTGELFAAGMLSGPDAAMLGLWGLTEFCHQRAKEAQDFSGMKCFTRILNAIEGEMPDDMLDSVLEKRGIHSKLFVKPEELG